MSPDELKELVRDHLEKKFKNVGDVEMDVSKEIRGHHINEYEVTVFKGATCEVEL